MNELFDMFKTAKKVYKYRWFFISIIIVLFIIELPYMIKERNDEKRMDYVSEIMNGDINDKNTMKDDIDEDKIEETEYYMENNYRDEDYEFVEIMYDEVKGKNIRYFYNGYDGEYHYFTLKSLFKEKKYVMETIGHYKKRINKGKFFSDAEYAVSLKKDNGELKLINKKEVEPSKKRQKELEQHYYSYEIMMYD